MIAPPPNPQPPVTGFSLKDFAAKIPTVRIPGFTPNPTYQYIPPAQDQSPLHVPAQGSWPSFVHHAMVRPTTNNGIHPGNLPEQLAMLRLFHRTPLAYWGHKACMPAITLSWILFGTAVGSALSENITVNSVASQIALLSFMLLANFYENKEHGLLVWTSAVAMTTASLFTSPETLPHIGVIAPAMIAAIHLRQDPIAGFCSTVFMTSAYLLFDKLLLPNFDSLVSQTPLLSSLAQQHPLFASPIALSLLAVLGFGFLQAFSHALEEVPFPWSHEKGFQNYRNWLKQSSVKDILGYHMMIIPGTLQESLAGPRLSALIWFLLPLMKHFGYRPDLMKPTKQIEDTLYHRRGFEFPVVAKTKNPDGSTHYVIEAE